MTLCIIESKIFDDDENIKSGKLHTTGCMYFMYQHDVITKIKCRTTITIS